MSIYLSSYISIYLYVLPAIHPSFQQSIYLSVCLSSHSSIYVSSHPSTYLAMHPSIQSSIYLAIHPFMYSSIHPSSICTSFELFAIHCSLLGETNTFFHSLYLLSLFHSTFNLKSSKQTRKVMLQNCQCNRHQFLNGSVVLYIRGARLFFFYLYLGETSFPLKQACGTFSIILFTGLLSS